MTRVVHLTSVHPPRDPRIFVKECQSLAEAGYEVILVAPDAPSGVEAGVRFVEFPRVENRFKRILGSSRRMADVAESLDADVYHVHDPELLPTAHRLARRGGIAVYDAHEHLAKSTSGKPYLPGPVATLAGRLAGAYEWFVSTRVAAVVAATPTIAAQFDPEHTVVVANYPLADQWLSGEGLSFSQYASRPNRVACVGGITEERNAPVLVAAAGRLRSPGATVSFAGTVAGTPVPSGPGVEYLGVLPSNGVRELLDSSRLGLSVLQPLPNYIESLPTKTFEYMAAGIPVVVSRETTVQAELVEEVGCGVVVAHDDIDGLAAAIDQLLSDPEHAFELGSRGRAAVEGGYSWSSQSERLLDLYRRLVPDTNGLTG